VTLLSLILHRRLQLALTLQTILDHQQIPRSRWQTALNFSTAPAAIFWA